MLESLVVGKSPKAVNSALSSNSDWTRDELILVLNLYLKNPASPPRKGSKEVLSLSRTLNRLRTKLFGPESRAGTFRNESNVYMKLMNFRRFDPHFRSEGKKGLSKDVKADEEVWEEFAGDAKRCQRVADAIVKSLDDPGVDSVWLDAGIDESFQTAPEGRLLTRSHLIRERSRKLVERKRNQVMKRDGKLICEVCRFDFAIHYGDHGKGFIECHHTQPLVTLPEGHKTHLDDLALVCSNCHRMIHRRKQWLSVAELAERVRKEARFRKSSVR